MTNGISGIFSTGVESWREGTKMMENLLARAGVRTVFSEPVSQGDYTVVTAAESTIGFGFGCGSGGGSSAHAPAGDEAGESERASGGHGDEGGGSGGGAGGSALSRPVAAISIGPHGVSVEPIVDPTKIALAFFTMIGAFLLMLGRMRRAARQ